MWANFKEHSRDGFKYETIGENAVNYKEEQNLSVYKYIDYDGEGGIASNETDKIRELRAQKKNQTQNASDCYDLNNTIFV